MKDTWNRARRDIHDIPNLHKIPIYGYGETVDMKTGERLVCYGPCLDDVLDGGDSIGVYEGKREIRCSRQAD